MKSVQPIAGGPAGGEIPLLRRRAMRLVERARAEAGLPPLDREALWSKSLLELCGEYAAAERALNAAAGRLWAADDAVK